MYRLLIVILLATANCYAQTKKPAPKGKPQQTAKDSVAAAPADTVDSKELKIKEAGTFAVYSKKPQFSKDKRMKLCIQLVHQDTLLNYCMNDSVCKDPEISKVLFEQLKGDTNYVLVYIDAFSKPRDKPACDA